MSDRQRLYPKKKSRKSRSLFSPVQTKVEKYLHFFACNPAKTPYLCRQIDNTHPTTHNTMKRRTSLFFLVLLLLLVGCKEKIDLKQVDSSMSVKTTIAAPLITIKAPLSEILGINDTTGRSDSLQWLYVKDSRYGTDKQLTSLIPEGTLYFRDTFNITLARLSNRWWRTSACMTNSVPSKQHSASPFPLLLFQYLLGRLLRCLSLSR